jgi:hypothetical protein
MAGNAPASPTMTSRYFPPSPSSPVQYGGAYPPINSYSHDSNGSAPVSPRWPRDDDPRQPGPDTDRPTDRRDMSLETPPGPRPILQDILNRLLRLERSFKDLNDVSSNVQLLRRDVDGLMAANRGESRLQPRRSYDSIYIPPVMTRRSSSVQYPPQTPYPSNDPVVALSNQVSLLTTSVSQLVSSQQPQQLLQPSPRPAKHLQLEPPLRNKRSFSAAAKPFTPTVGPRFSRDPSPVPMPTETGELAISPTKSPILTPGTANLYERWEACGLQGALLKAVAHYG